MKKHAHRASALVIVLLLVSLVTVLAISFLVSMRLERSMAHTHQQNVQAGHFEQIARDVAIARLQHGFEYARTNLGTNLWATQPGAFHYHGPTNSSWQTIDLHSGAATGTNNDESVNLNRPELENDTLFAIAGTNDFSTGEAEDIRVNWIYYDDKGNLGNVLATNSIGRFAFWIDDESSKVNVNTAWKAANTTDPAAHPSHVDLPTLGLTEEHADGLRDKLANNQWFNTVEDINAVTGDSAFIDGRRFHLTHYNHTPALNPFGQPKLILTTQRSRANESGDSDAGNYLKILTGNQGSYVDPGLYANLDAAAIENVVNKIANYLRRTDWPYPTAAGKSIAEKYPPILPEQIAVNILEYVRASESETPVVDPIRGYMSGGKFRYDPSYNGNNAIAGNNRGFRTTEFAVWVAPSPASTIGGKDLYVVKFMQEIHLPENYGIEQIDLRDFYYAFQFIGGSGITNKKPGITTLSGNYILPKGGYEVVVQEARVSADTGPNSRATAVSAIRGPRFSVSRNLAEASAGRRLEVMPESVASGLNYVDYTVQGPAITETNIHSRSVADPSVNNSKADWILTDPNTLGAVNNNVVAPAPHGPEQDRITSGGALSPASQQFPRPGRDGIRSVAELGYVHTGILTHDNTQSGVAYRTLRLQPRAVHTQLPDWAVLDLFTAPLTVPVIDGGNRLLRPAAGEGGKVNLNASVKPFETNGLSRVLPLQAAIKSGFSSPETPASRLLEKAPAVNAGYLSATNEPFFSTGQVTEVAGVSDGGESSEANLIGVIDLLTTRSGVFTIYSVGQSIQRTPSGAVRILSDRRNKTLIEFDLRHDPATWKIIYTQDL